MKKGMAGLQTVLKGVPNRVRGALQRARKIGIPGPRTAASRTFAVWKSHAAFVLWLAGWRYAWPATLEVYLAASFVRDVGRRRFLRHPFAFSGAFLSARRKVRAEDARLGAAYLARRPVDPGTRSERDWTASAYSPASSAPRLPMGGADGTPHLTSTDNRGRDGS